MAAQWLEEKYIGLVGATLGHFHKQSRTTFTFRCPFCGDSQKRQNKTRGYFFLYQRQYFYKCHNCNVSMSLRGFLKRAQPELFREYQLDVLRQERPELTTTAPSTPERSNAMFGFGRTTKPAVSLPSIASLADTHIARQYCDGRGLPATAHKHLYFTDAWTTWITDMGWSYALPEDHAPRLIIPWFSREGNLLGAQARRIDATGKEARYVTLKHTSDTEKIYGLDRLDFHKLIYVVEGPLDSWFLPNCLAAMGSDLMHVHEKYLQGYHVVYIWDNEPRNLEVSRHMQAAIKKGLPLVVWPAHLAQKDLNEMSQAGYNVEDLVRKHTYTGLRAELEFLRWKKYGGENEKTK